MGVQNTITKKLSVLGICPTGRKEIWPKLKHISFLCVDSAGEALSFAQFLILYRVTGVINSLKRTQGGQKRKERRERFLAGKMKGWARSQAVI